MLDGHRRVRPARHMEGGAASTGGYCHAGWTSPCWISKVHVRGVRSVGIASIPSKDQATQATWAFHCIQQSTQAHEVVTLQGSDADTCLCCGGEVSAHLARHKCMHVLTTLDKSTTSLFHALSPHLCAYEIIQTHKKPERRVARRCALNTRMRLHHPQLPSFKCLFHSAIMCALSQFVQLWNCLVLTGPPLERL
eukprot:1136861-Pelagomonas_calceolata.AAC.11